MLALEQLPLVKDLPSPDGKWELVELIGEGNYGEIYKAKSIINGDIAAVKVMEAVLDKEEDIKAELNVFENHAHHPNIVDFYGAFLKRSSLDDRLWIVMEYCPAGSVTDLAKAVKERAERFSEDLIAYILREVVAGLCYLHSSCVLHRDVKGQNVLLTRTARVKLIDFGISAVVNGTTGRRRTAIGTPYWMAPEVIACESQLDCDYDARSDIWSLGITAIEVADSTPPLFGEHPMRALLKIPKNTAPTLHNPSMWSKCFNNFISLCLMKDFEKRPFAKDLLSHNFVHNVPNDPRSIRRRLVSLMESTQSEETAPLTNSSTSTAHLDNVQHNLKALRTLDTVSDLACLEYINENVIISQLWKRYQKQQIYTYVGDILISINPFQKLNIYNDRYSLLYCNTPRSHLPPHIFAIANSAYQSMVHERRNQCCVVSGESGAGKTEASNILVQQFMRLGLAQTRSLEEKILKINPLMESFGNARTIINNNSSRFGKYLELQFTSEGHVVGAHVSEYLLEKSRVISQARRERNFHIFYYMLAGLASRKQLGKYRLRSGQHYRYLEHRGTHKGNVRQDALYSERFEQIEQAFYLFGLTKSEVSSVLGVLAAILNIGDIRLAGEMHPHIGEIGVITNTDRVNDVATLLQIRGDAFIRAITTSQVITYGEVIVKPNTPEKALDARDAIAKTLYGRLFSWIVNRINPTLNSTSGSSSELHIGILDIFGFENFRKNSFEQLCINVANEQLQFYFNQHVFAWEQEEYEREGINAASVGYHDNRPLLDLLLSKPMGLLSLLDEESKFPRSTDHSLAAKFHGNFESSSYYSRPKDGGPTFAIHHYAGSVTYETAHFLEKNRDTLKPDVAKLLQKSANPVVHSLFFTPLSRTGSLSAGSSRRMIQHQGPPSATPLFNRRAPHYRSNQPRHHAHGHTPLSASNTVTAKLSQTVSTYFINSLRELMSKMLMAKPFFVRCIRPNEMKSPDLFQPEKVLLQLRYTGVLETTRIRKEGFSHRILFSDFVERYKIICFQLSQRVPGTSNNCSLILEEAKLENYAIGKSKVFLKYYHSERLLQILSRYNKAAIILQSIIRGWQGRRKANQRRVERDSLAAVKIQASVRRFLTRCRYLKLLQKRGRAAVAIQTAFRGWRLRCQYLDLLQRRQVAAIKLQSVVRGWLCCSKYRKYQAQRKAAVKVQRCVRRWLVVCRKKRRQQQEKEAKEEAERKRNANAAAAAAAAMAVAAQRKKKPRESIRLKLQQEVQAQAEKMAALQERLQGPDKEAISAEIIQRAYRRSVANRKKRRAQIAGATRAKTKAGSVDTRNQQSEHRKIAGVSPNLRARWSHDKPSESPLLQSQEPSNLRGFSRIRRDVVPSRQPWQVVFLEPHRVPPWQAAAKKPDSGVQCQQGGGDEPTKEQPWTGKLPKAVTFQQSNTNDLTAEAVVKEKPSPAGSSSSIRNVRRMFEDLVSHQAAEVKRGRSSGVVKLIGHQRVKAKRSKTKPDSVIQKLLERFDPLKLNSTNSLSS